MLFCDAAMAEHNAMMAQGDAAMQQRARLDEAAGAGVALPVGGEMSAGEEYQGDGASTHMLARSLRFTPVGIGGFAGFSVLTGVFVSATAYAGQMGVVGGEQVFQGTLTTAQTGEVHMSV